MRPSPSFPLLAVIAAFWPSLAVAVDYLRDIKPLLEEKCYSCHSALMQEADLRLETRQLMIDAVGGAVIEPKSAATSRLIERISATDDQRMPPPGEGSALNAHEIQLIRDWIDAGAIAPDEPIPDEPSQHWAFQTIVRPQHISSIDNYFASVHQQQNIQAQQRATQTIALRRLYLDLVGLPPTNEQLRDDREWETIVDELLTTPQHGERWARHWMDIWRYSDWYGLGAQLRNSQKHLWHWRDWIIDSLNEDKPYDQMIQEMIAADELSPTDASAIRATGFLARNYYLFNRTTWLDSTIEHTGKAFLGLTLNCCKCHDHKYDPISQLDYYRFRAIFEPHQVRLDPVPGTIDLEKDGLPRVFDDQLTAETFVHIRGDEKNLDRTKVVDPGVPSLFADFATAIQPIDLPVTAYAPIARDYVANDRLKATAEKIIEAAKNLVARKPTYDIAVAKLTAVAIEYRSLQATIDAERLGVTDDKSDEYHAAKTRAAQLQAELTVAEAQLDKLLAGEDKAKQEAAAKKLKEATERISQANEKKPLPYKPIYAAKKALETPAHNDGSYAPNYSPKSSGRRLALARWITDRRNPLTARVAVNHIWLRHFGEPLVADVFDFGLRTKRPVHADLLDFLAVELIESNWSMRHIHRLMVNSELYQRSSSNEHVDKKTRGSDPTNQFYWRMNTIRMQSQLLRDSLLQLSGELDPTIGGPSINPNSATKRRSIYLVHSRDVQDKFLSMFDDADLLQCYRRSESIVPQQALTLANSQLSLTVSQRISEQLWNEMPSKDLDAFVNAAFSLLIARSATTDELHACNEFADDLAEVLREKPETERASRIRERLVHALLNHNDFISVR